MLPIHTVLHPTDFSESSRQAFRLACTLASDYGARLIVLHVATPPAFFYGEGALTGYPQEYLNQLYAQLTKIRPKDPAITVDHALVEGDPATEILRTARQTRSDAIVMGTHGRSGLGRLLMGSVAEKVSRKAPCPVVTARAPARGAAVPASAEPVEVA
jgi:nucleotide-binding universal stress UspA family protein